MTTDATLGEIRMFAFGKVPTGWLPCDGALLQIRDNQALYSLVGNRFGGDGQVTFAVPDLRGRVPVHRGPEIAFGSRGGEVTHTLVEGEMARHTHQIRGTADPAAASKPHVWATTSISPTHSPTYSATANGVLGSGALSMAGGNEPHTNMQPYVVVQFCVCISGRFPVKG
ncbi:MAG: phage tail protein [Acidimicrobiales bacterium]